MCEILLLVLMGKKIAQMANEKGRSGALFVVMLVLCWFGGEIFGAIFGAILVGGDEDKMFVAYLCGLVGAGAGAGLTFLTVSLLTPAHDYEEDFRPRRRPRRVSLDDEDDDRPRRRRRYDEEDEVEKDDRPRRRRRDDDGSFEARRDLP